MSAPASDHPIDSEASRRHLSARQAGTVGRLAQATVEELADSTYEQLSVRAVARRAGVAPATAYNYFSSKEHLLAVVFWHNLNATDPALLTRIDDDPSSVDAAERAKESAAPEEVEGAMAQIAVMAAENPALAAGYSVAMLSHDPDVGRIRTEIGRTMHDRLANALAADPRLSGQDDEALSTLLLILTGGLVQAGMGHLGYDELPGVFERAVAQILGSRADASQARTTDSRPHERRSA